MDKIKLFGKNDLIVLIIIAALCAVLLLPRLFEKDSRVAVISVNGEEICTIDLDGVEDTYKIKPDCSPKLTVEVAKGKIRVSEAECHDKLCVKCGWLDSAGDTAVCLPAKVCVTIKGTADSPDIVTY